MSLESLLPTQRRDAEFASRHHHKLQNATETPAIPPTEPIRLKGRARLALAQFIFYGATASFAFSDRSALAFATVETLYAGALALTATAPSVLDSK